MVVRADPIHFQNSGPVIIVGCRPQHVPHAVCPGSRGQCVLELGTFFLEIFRELPRQRPRDQPTECASSGDSSHDDARLGPIRLRTIRLRPAGRSRNWPKSNRWCLLFFFFFSFFLFFFLFCLSFTFSFSFFFFFLVISQDNPRTPKRAHFRVPAFKNTTKFHERTQERERRMIIVAERKKESAKFWAPHPSGPPPFGPHPLWSQNSTSKNWPNSKLAELEIGRSGSRSLSHLRRPWTMQSTWRSKVLGCPLGHAPVRHWTLPRRQNKVEHIHLVHENFQMLVCSTLDQETTLAGHSANSSGKSFCPKTGTSGWNSRTSAGISRTTSSTRLSCIARKLSCANQTLTGSRNLTQLHLLACCPGPHFQSGRSCLGDAPVVFRQRFFE